MLVIEYNGKRPQIGENVFVAPTAVLIGDVVLEEGVSIWFGAVLRGDQNQIIVQKGSNIQDNSVIHSDDEGPTIIGADANIGHNVTMEACKIGAGAVIGMNAVILNGAEVGEKALVAAGAVVGNFQKIPGGYLAAGIPAVVKKPLSGASLEAVEHSAAKYYELRDSYLAQNLDKIQQ